MKSRSSIFNIFDHRRQDHRKCATSSICKNHKNHKSLSLEPFERQTADIKKTNYRATVLIVACSQFTLFSKRFLIHFLEFASSSMQFYVFSMNSFHLQCNLPYFSVNVLDFQSIFYKISHNLLHFHYILHIFCQCAVHIVFSTFSITGPRISENEVQKLDFQYFRPQALGSPKMRHKLDLQKSQKSQKLEFRAI